MREGICKYFPDCRFYKFFSAEVERKDKITIFHQYINIYCFGILQHNCYRFIKKENGEPLADDITPTGIKYSPESE